VERGEKSGMLLISFLIDLVEEVDEGFQTEEN
jgi:hypothetical protein